MREKLILEKLDEIIKRTNRLIDIGEDFILKETDYYGWVIKQHYKEEEARKDSQ